MQTVHIGPYPCVFVVYYNHKKAQQLAKKREKALRACEKDLKKLSAKLNRYRLKTKKQVKASVKALLDKHKFKKFLQVRVLACEPSDKLSLGWERKNKELAHQMRRDGRFMLLSDLPVESAKQLLCDYRSHNAGEIAFSVIKGPIKLRPVFVYNEQHVRGHIFVCQMVLFLRSLFNYLLKKSKLGLIPERAVQQIKSIHLNKVVIEQVEREIWLLTKISTECQKIFDAVGFDPQQMIDAQGPSLLK